MISMLHPALRSYAGIPGYIIGWLIFLSAIVLFAYTIKKRYMLLRSGRPDPRFENIAERIRSLFVYGIFQKRQPRYLWAGLIHLIIFWGFVILGLRSIDLLTQALGIAFIRPILEGRAGALYSILRDITEISVLCACIWAAERRILVRPARYEGSSHIEAYLVLGLISALMMTDMAYDGISLLILGGDYSDFAPGARFFAGLLSGLGPSILKTGHALSFWLHIFLFLIFLCFLPMGKHFHIITALPNVFFRRLKKGSIKPARWDVSDLEELDTIGVSSVEDLTWKHILDLYSCTECGRCTDRCPAAAAGRPLSPKKLTMKLRDYAYERYPVFGKGMAGAADKENGEQRLEIPGGVIGEDEIWSCTTCGACEEECPVFIEYIDKIVDMRRRLIETARAPKAFNQVFMHLEKTGNPFGKPASKRSDWIRDLEGFPVRVLKKGDEVDCLYFVDSYPSYDPRAQAVAIAIAKTMHFAGIDFGILGAKERDSGHQVRRMGEEGLFELLKEENREVLEGIKFRRIVTTDPHAFNALRKDYGIDFEILHYSVLFDSLLHDGVLKPKIQVQPGSYTYHDPCYLGRHNGIYNKPRRLLNALPGVRYVEMQNSRDRSFCCGGGDVILWHEIAEEKERPAALRIKMAKDAGATVMVTACPFCLIHFEDAIKTAGLENEMRVIDLAELLVSTL